MHVCAIASARATIGGPSFELRTPSRNASFHRRTRLPPAWTVRALKASLGSASDAAPAPAATRNCRRDSDCSRADERDLLRPREIEPPDEEVKTSRLFELRRDSSRGASALPRTARPCLPTPRPRHTPNRDTARTGQQRTLKPATSRTRAGHEHVTAGKPAP